MKALCKNSKELDLKAIQKGLDELMLMENAGASLARLVKKEAKKLGQKNGKRAKILFLLGGGNNAADGLVALRQLKNSYGFKLAFKENENFKKQEQILKNYGFKFLEKEPNFNDFHIIIDCIFGTGLNRKVDEKTAEILKKVNKSKALKIACDIPTNLGFKPCFKADITLCMGSLKESLLEDFAKESVGKLKIAKLGLRARYFNEKASSFLLEKKDLRLIKRKKVSNKGDYGHIFVLGSKSAGSLAAMAALNFGAGLVSLLGKESFSPLIMCKEVLDERASVLCAGMGLKDLSFLKDELAFKKPLVLDAECFLSKDILPHLNRSDVVITPHPKEFTRLYKLCFNEDLSLDELFKKRFFYARNFAKHYECVLVLKGANSIITQKDKLFVINLGNEALAKGGSGDVLAGMIAALMFKFKPLKAAKNAALAHALVAKKYKFNKNSFDALKLIKGLKCL